MTDWRLPENRREIFQRSYTFSLRHLNFPGMVYSMLPAIAEAFDLDDDGRAWLAWLNGNTQNVVTSMLMLEVAPRPQDWKQAVDFWNENFKALEFDTDRRHQKSAFGKATEQWAEMNLGVDNSPAFGWFDHSLDGKTAFAFAMSHPYMGRISAWSFMEFAKILLPWIPDVDGWYLRESSSRSHRNALCLLSGYDDAWGWDGDQAEIPFLLDLFDSLDSLAEDLLAEADGRNAVLLDDQPLGAGFETPFEYDHHPFVTRLTMESALCTFKSWHKPNRRYPNVYADMMYQRIKKAEARMGRSLDMLWDIRKQTLPPYLRLEENPRDPGLAPIKQNHFRDTGEVPMMSWDFPDMQNQFDDALRNDEFPMRKDPKW